MGPIQLLPAHLVKQIAAGECIERPASVVKELVENSLDAGAGRIEVHVEDAGNRLIRVQDNGCGIPAAEFPLALASHATSKLTCSEDLSCIRTLGFRGEALASISSVAEITLASCCGESGFVVEAAGDKVGEARPVGMPRGTSVEVRNLFFNVPARRKFLKSKAVEMGHVTEVVTALALSASQVAFQLTHNGQLVFSAVAGDPLARIREILCTKNLEFFQAAAEEEHFRLDAYLGLPSHFKSNNKWQYFFLNGRIIKDRVLMRSLADAYRDYIPEKRHPVAVCYLTVDPDWVDVNVHPAKVEVRHRDGQKVYHLIYRTVLGGLKKHENVPQIPLFPMDQAEGEVSEMEPAAKSPPERESLRGEGPSLSDGLPEIDRMAGPRVDWAGEDRVAEKAEPISACPAPKTRNFPAPEEKSPPVAPMSKKTFRPPADLPLFSGGHPERNTAVAKLPAGPGTTYLQVHDSYLVMEIPEGIAIIDQHALHERVLYDRLRRLLKSGKTISQPLLFPETIYLGPQEMAIFGQCREDLRKIGIDACQSGPDAIEVRCLPQIFGKVSASGLVSDLLEQVEQSRGMSMEEIMEDRLAMMACKAAVKAGDRLSPEEMASLLASKDEADNPCNCPHGRPTLLKMTLTELEKYFYRR